MGVNLIMFSRAAFTALSAAYVEGNFIMFRCAVVTLNAAYGRGNFFIASETVAFSIIFIFFNFKNLSTFFFMWILDLIWVLLKGHAFMLGRTYLG